MSTTNLVWWLVVGTLACSSGVAIAKPSKTPTKQAGDKPKPPTIMSVTPSIGSVDAPTVQLHGKNFGSGASAVYTVGDGSYESCKVSNATDDSLSCEMKSGNEIVPDHPIHFIVFARSGKATVSSEPSTATYTPADPASADVQTIECPQPGARCQLHIVGGPFVLGKSGVPEVFLDAQKNKVPCDEVYLIGASDLFCYASSDTVKRGLGVIAVERGGEAWRWSDPRDKKDDATCTPVQGKSHR